MTSTRRPASNALLLTVNLLEWGGSPTISAPSPFRPSGSARTDVISAAFQAKRGGRPVGSDGSAPGPTPKRDFDPAYRYCDLVASSPAGSQAGSHAAGAIAS